MSSIKDKESVKKGRRWRFSKKKMKTEPETEILRYDLKELLEKKNINLKPRVNSCKNSKLSPSLLDILKKSVALGYFFEYLAEQKKKCLLDFWLEAETLHMVYEINYSRRTPTSSRRRFSRSKSLNATPTKGDHQLSTSESFQEETDSEYTNSDKRVSDLDFKCSNTGVKNSLKKSESADTAEGVFGTRSKTIETENIDKNNKIDTLNPSNHEGINTISSAENPDVKSDDDGVTRNTFDPPNKRRSSTLRSYEEFKSRSKSRSNIVDAVSIYSKYISLNADQPINLPSGERQWIEGTICKDESQLDPLCFVKAQEFAFQQLESMYEDFLSTTNMISYQMKVLEEKEIKLQDVLYDEPILFYFLEFLDLHNAKAVYEFYITAESFEEDIERKIKEQEYDQEESINDGMHIYERYFSMKCENQLIADDKLRIVLENNICREDGPQSNCFCIPMAYAWTALSEVYLPMFLRSNIYTAYQNHLKKTLQHTEDMKSCSSRSSLSLEENLPLMDRNPPPMILQKSESKLDLFEDTNLEEFWFKPLNNQANLSASRLTMGHMNEFGVFCSGMEEQPLDEKDHDSSVKKLGKKMKDLLRGETTEETEQLAWDRARKIIDDIQKQTQG